MALSISDITARTKASFARSNLFEVRIQYYLVGAFGRTINLNCYNAQIPGISINTTDKDLGYRSIGFQKLYDDIILSFYCSEDLNELAIMQTWLEQISNPIDNRIGYYEDYAQRNKIKIITKGRDGKKTLTTTLHEAYPKKIDPMQLDYGSGDIMRMTVNFTYRYFTQEWHGTEEEEQPVTGKKAVQKNKVLAAHNVRDDKNKLDPMWEIRNQSWKYR